jgi:hypothetical protein
MSTQASVCQCVKSTSSSNTLPVHLKSASATTVGGQFSPEPQHKAWIAWPHNNWAIIWIQAAVAIHPVREHNLPGATKRERALCVDITVTTRHHELGGVDHTMQ